MYRLLYSNCWEDGEVVDQALNIEHGKSYLSIASAGDNTLSMLAHNPGSVLAVDKNPAQLACLDLKRVAIEHLSYSDTLAFLGVADSNRRLRTYHLIRNALAPFARRFWDSHRTDIAHGVIHAGITERNFKRFRNLVLPLAISRHDRQQLLSDLPAEKRKQVCDKVLTRSRFCCVMRTVFSRAMVRQLRIGTYSTFYCSENGSLANIIIETVKKGFSSPEVYKNPYVMYIMTGNYHHALPLYLQKPVFNRIKRNIKALTLFSGTIDQALTEYISQRFNGFNLSDIFEYMNPYDFQLCIHRLLTRAVKGARLVYWNTLQSRNGSLFSDGRLRKMNDLAHHLFQQNRSFFYNSIEVDEVC